jgi:hypothetical protein
MQLQGPVQQQVADYANTFKKCRHNWAQERFECECGWVDRALKLFGPRFNTVSIRSQTILIQS